MIRNYCKSLISAILKIILSIKSLITFNNIKTKTQFLVLKLKSFNSSSLKILQKILLPIFLILTISACDRSCGDADDFGSESVFIDASREGNVIGEYDPETGGQIALPYEPGLRVNGDPLVIKITGAWSAWFELQGKHNLNIAPACNLCIKKNTIDNCICRENENPELLKFNLKGEPNSNKFINAAGNEVARDCNDPEQQDNPNLCSCSKAGTVYDLDTYMISRNHISVDESAIEPDFQNLCKFTSGAGLYLGLYGRDGLTTPLRMYHLQSTESGCDVPRTDGKCLDFEGNNITHYIYRSKDAKPLVRTDRAGDNGTDTDSSDDEYHEPGEVIKLNIFDHYYSDNSGGYKLEFLSGVDRDKSSGLLENLVRFVEDILLGKFTGSESQDSQTRGLVDTFFKEFRASDATGERTGGILEIMYNTIVKDSAFQALVQISLILYITFFGAGILMGTVELATKEISTRVIKIALIALFVGFGDYNVWQTYNDIVVGFFKHGMDNVITMFSSIVDAGSADVINVVQGDRFTSSSQATRFSYADKIILMLISDVIHKKMWSLLFTKLIFGVVLIPLMYFIIIFFIYTVLTAAVLYLSALIKMVVVLALGPIFILASLFTHTEEMFKKWLTFLAARSMEMIALFLILYLFLDLIEFRIKELFYFACSYQDLDLRVFRIPIWMVDEAGPNGTRPFGVWMGLIFSLLAIVFLLKVIIDQISTVVSDLVSVSGVQTTPTDDITNSLMQGLKKGTTALAGKTVSVARKKIGNAMTAVGRVTGASRTMIGIRRAMPIRGRESRKIDKTIQDARKQAIADGYSGKELDHEIRKRTLSTLADIASRDGKTLKTELIRDRLKKELIEKPMRKYVSQRSKELGISEENAIYGSKLVEQLRTDTQKWAEENLNMPKEDIQEQLDKLRATNWWRPSFTQRQGSALRKAEPKVGKAAELLSAEKNRMGRLKGKLLRNQVAGRHHKYADDKEARTQAQKDYLDRLMVLGKAPITQDSKLAQGIKGAKAQFDEAKVQYKVNKFISNLDPESRKEMKEYLDSDERFSQERINRKVELIKDQLQLDLQNSRKTHGTKAGEQEMERRANARLEHLNQQIKAFAKEKNLGQKGHNDLKKGVKVAQEGIEELRKQIKDPPPAMERDLNQLQSELEEVKKYQKDMPDDSMQKIKEGELTKSLEEAKDGLGINLAPKDGDVDTSQLSSYQSDLALAKSNKFTAQAKVLKLKLDLMKAKAQMDDSPAGKSKVKQLENEISSAESSLKTEKTNMDKAQKDYDDELARVRDAQAGK